MKDKEIELKFIINPEIKSAMLNDLEKSATKISVSRLVDTYYIPYFKNFEINGETIECVRIRENDKGSTLTYKKVHREANPIYCDEFETMISDKNQMEKILFALGFSIQMIIDKTRETYKMDKFEFDFDLVKNLGDLLEIELKDENANIEMIYDFVAKYGLGKSDVTYEGIQTLMKKAQSKNFTRKD